MAKKFVSWRRVSTKRQNASGLGLEAQKDIIRYFIERDGGEWVADYAECYTGTELSGCIELQKAIQHAKRDGAVLVIAKTDRFRNTIEALQVYEEMGDGNIMFCDLPHTDKFTLTLFFALAEREALIVSIRTKQALDAKKARGEKTGGASEKWVESYIKKSNKETHEIGMKRGRTKNLRHIESKDVQAFIKILKSVFPDACNGDIFDWKWNSITTKESNRITILTQMKTYKELDNTLFAKWDLSGDDLSARPLQVKLAAQIQSLRNSVKKLNENKDNEKCDAIE